MSTNETARGKFVKNEDGTYSWQPSPPEEQNVYLFALSYKQVEQLPDADGKQSRR